MRRETKPQSLWWKMKWIWTPDLIRVGVLTEIRRQKSGKVQYQNKKQKTSVNMMARVLAHILEKEQWTKETVLDRNSILQENLQILARKQWLLIKMSPERWWRRQWGKSHMNRTQTSKDLVLKGNGFNI